MARQAIQALDKILQYKQQEKRADVQEALAFMQYGMQKRAADVKEYGLRMENLKQANQQFQLDVASNFLQTSGLKSLLDAVPTEVEGVEEGLEGITEISKLLKKKQYGKFDKNNSQSIASALWSYKQSNDPSTILNLANRIESLSVLKKGTDSDKNLLKGFKNISNLPALRQVSKQAQQSMINRDKILEEQFDFATGNTDIQEGIGMFSKEAYGDFQKSKQSKPEPEDDILKLADEFESEEGIKSDELEYEVGDHLSNHKRKVQEKQFVQFYGMSSDAANTKHFGGLKDYRSSEGREVFVPYRGDVAVTVQDILGGLRSTCTYAGALKLKQLSKCTTFVRCTQQFNGVYASDDK